MNFIFPNFVYHPQYSPEYQIDVFILDDRNSTERQKIPIEGTVNKEMISAAFRDLVPYSEIAVNIHSSGTNQQLHDLIASNYKYADSWLMGGVFGSPQRYGVVDLRPVYKYMLDNIASFEPNPRVAGDKITIPVFAFALSGQTYFTYTYKWQIGKIDWETGALLGISLNEGVFISLNQWEFTRGDHVDPPQSGKGEGFTRINMATSVTSSSRRWGISRMTTVSGKSTKTHSSELMSTRSTWKQRSCSVKWALQIRPARQGAS
jgi:hypothetical protein